MSPLHKCTSELTWIGWCPRWKCRPTREEIDLGTYHPRFVPVEIPLESFGSEPITAQSFLLQQSASGAYNLWIISCLHQQCMLGRTLTCNDWYYSWWIWWVKSYPEMGLDPSSHLRKACFFNTRSKCLDDARFRFLPVPTCCTYGLIHPLARFSCPSSSTKKKAEFVQRFRMMLHTVLFWFFGGKHVPIPSVSTHLLCVGQGQAGVVQPGFGPCRSLRQCDGECDSAIAARVL